MGQLLLGLGSMRNPAGVDCQRLLCASLGSHDQMESPRAALTLSFLSIALVVDDQI